MPGGHDSGSTVDKGLPFVGGAQFLAAGGGLPICRNADRRAMDLPATMRGASWPPEGPWPASATVQQVK